MYERHSKTLKRRQSNNHHTTSVKLVTVPRTKLLWLGYSYRQALNAYLFQRS